MIIVGSRPKVQTTGAGQGRRLRAAPAIAASESALWRGTMEAIHGPDWQALLRAPWATDPDAYLTVDFEGAVIRGSRLALCLYIFMSTHFWNLFCFRGALFLL